MIYGCLVGLHRDLCVYLVIVCFQVCVGLYCVFVCCVVCVVLVLAVIHGRLPVLVRDLDVSVCACGWCFSLLTCCSHSDVGTHYRVRNRVIIDGRSV